MPAFLLVFTPQVVAAIGALGAAMGIAVWGQTPAGQQATQQAAQSLANAVSRARTAVRDAVTDDTCEDCKRRKEHWHHEMPKQFRDRFADAGLDIDAPENGRVMPGSEHLSMHGQGYNREWQEFFRANPYADRSEILQQRDMMVKEYGLNAYRRPSGRYPQL